MVKEKLQPEINIGMVGHVDHGKTTLVKSLSGMWTDTHSEEIKRGITIRLGYANAVFVKTKDKICMTEVQAKKEKKEYSILRKVSFVDAPGHESLMATMLSGATIMDGAILLVAANDECPQPQTREHLMALEISGIKNVIIVQNKIDTVSKDRAIENYKQIKAFIKGTAYEKAPIIPISAQQNINMDVLIETIEKIIPTPKRDSKKDPIMFIARSFDINKPGTLADNINGGILGGSLKQGVLKVGDEIEIKPGISIEGKSGKTWKPVITTVIGLNTGNGDVKEVGPGGSIGVMTSLDPSIVKSDSLAGNIAGKKDKLPPQWNEFELDIKLLKRVVGAKEDLKVEPIKVNEPLMLNVNSAATVGIVTGLAKNSVKCVLKLPVCADAGSNVTISRQVGNRFRLIGYGIIKE